MGLLDALSYSGGSSGAGLLDFLRQLQPQNSFSGLQSDQVQYGQPLNARAQQQPLFPPTMSQPNAQPSPLDNAQWPFGPNGAPSQANAQVIPQQPPPVMQAPQMQAQPQGPGIGDRLGASLQSFANSGGMLPAFANGVTSLISGQRTDPTGVAQQQQAQFQNQTVEALVKRGADRLEAKAAIGNAPLMTALVTKYFGKDQSLVNAGSGKLYDPVSKSWIVAPANEDEKTPNSALEYNFYKKNIPAGETPMSYQAWMATKDTDPSKISVLNREGELWKKGPDGNPIILHKNESAQAEATLDDATVKAMGAQYLAGDKSVMQNLGRGAQGAANIVKLRTEIYKQSGEAGLNAKDIVNTFNEQAGNLAGQRSIGTRAANISLAANEANNMIPIALKASEAVPRTQYMPLNQAIQAVQKGNSSPELARFVAATNSLVNAYVRAVSPSGVPTDSMREHAYSMLNSAQSHQAYTAVTSIMQDEMKAALQAPGQVRKELRGAETPRESQGQSGDAIYEQAKAAIARGAPRDKVLERMRQNGVDASGL